jgi:fibronectin type III domain protein
VNGLGKKLGLVAAATFLLGALGVPAASATAAQADHVPGQPSRVKALAQDHGALVSWRPPATNGGSPLTGYVIKASPGGKTVHTLAVTSFLVGGLRNGATYTFTVAAVNKSGAGTASLRSAAIRPHAATVPGTPRPIVAVAGFK